jgi:hypothetical protein
MKKVERSKEMSAVKTTQIRIINPKEERLIDEPASQNLIEIDESETFSKEIPLERYRLESSRKIRY